MFGGLLHLSVKVQYTYGSEHTYDETNSSSHCTLGGFYEWVVKPGQLKTGFLPLLEIRENWKAFFQSGKVREFGIF